jgi:hypothetical protein
MENGNTSKKKSKKKKIRNNSPQASNGSEKVSLTINSSLPILTLMFYLVVLQTNFFCGFSSRTVRNICEQVDSTDIQPEVYSVSYIKTLIYKTLVYLKFYYLRDWLKMLPIKSWS